MKIQAPKHYLPAIQGLALAVCAFVLIALGAPPARPQKPPAAPQKSTISSFDRDRIMQMLRSTKEDLKKYYYDPTFRGIDLDAHFKATEERLKQASSFSHAYRILAQSVVDLNDSHTWFSPPIRPVRVDYGWQLLMVGDKCYLIGVEPGSDAAAKGLKPGDQVISLDDSKPTREDLWKMKYVYYLLDPRRGVKMTVQSPDGKQRQLDVMARVEEGKRVTDLTDPGAYDEMERQDENVKHLFRHRSQTEGDIFIWKMPQFDTESKMSEMMGKAGKYKSLILDLRGNTGGDARSLARLVGYFFDHDIKIADLKGRKEMKPSLAKSVGGDAYRGKVVVLVDSESASASEIFARVMQLEKRGVVIGDRTMGAVMGSRYYGHQAGNDKVAFYGAAITEMNLIMKDGVSLEHVGVVPDELLMPTAKDLAAQRDPVLARATALLGVELKPERAGTFFPMEWVKH